MPLDEWLEPPDPPEMKECPDCEGTGNMDGSLHGCDCLRCEGTGEVVDDSAHDYFDDDMI